MLQATLEMVGLSKDTLILTSMKCLYDLLARSDRVKPVASPEFIDIFIDVIRHYSLRETFTYESLCPDLIRYLVDVTDGIINRQPALWEYVKSDFRKLKVIFDFSCELLKRPWYDRHKSSFYPPLLSSSFSFQAEVVDVAKHYPQEYNGDSLQFAQRHFRMSQGRSRRRPRTTADAHPRKRRLDQQY